jgi:hypothetical protein
MISQSPSFISGHCDLEVAHKKHALSTEMCVQARRSLERLFAKREKEKGR